MHKYLDIIISLFVAVICGCLLMISDLPMTVQIIIGVILTLFVPGYVLAAAMFESEVRRIPERILFSIGLSVLIVVLGALLLNLTPMGFERITWAILLIGVTLAASIVAVVRRSRSTGGTPPIPSIHIRPRQVLLLLLAASIFFSATFIRIRGVRMEAPAFTELWMVPVPDTDPQIVDVGVKNMELSRVSYRLELKVDGVRVHEWDLIQLENEETWRTTVSLPALQEDKERVEFFLYRHDDPDTVYRTVFMDRNSSTESN